jgi:hypothetical protein
MCFPSVSKSQSQSIDQRTIFFFFFVFRTYRKSLLRFNPRSFTALRKKSLKLTQRLEFDIEAIPLKAISPVQRIFDF